MNTESGIRQSRSGVTLESNHMRQLNAVKIEIGIQRGNYNLNSRLYPKAHGSDLKTLVTGWDNVISKLPAPDQSERAAIAKWKKFVAHASVPIALSYKTKVPPGLSRLVWDELFSIAALLSKRKAPVPPWAFTSPPSPLDAPLDTWFTERLGLLAALAVGALGVGYLVRKSK